ncbi:MAG TPA: hypothetical protein VLM89_01335, partial [Phycisphaerae bacterium]|nr:hypothetical protein [Phycisphaerae bacterium]
CRGPPRAVHQSSLRDSICSLALPFPTVETVGYYHRVPTGLGIPYRALLLPIVETVGYYHRIPMGLDIPYRALLLPTVGTVGYYHRVPTGLDIPYRALLLPFVGTVGYYHRIPTGLDIPYRALLLPTVGTAGYYQLVPLGLETLLFALLLPTVETAIHDLLASANVHRVNARIHSNNSMLLDKGVTFRPPAQAGGLPGLSSHKMPGFSHYHPVNGYIRRNAGRRLLPQ